MVKFSCQHNCDISSVWVLFFVWKKNIRDNRNIVYASNIDIHDTYCKIDMINLFTREKSKKVAVKIESESEIIRKWNN